MDYRKELGGEPPLLLLRGFNAGRTGCACALACPVPTYCLWAHAQRGRGRSCACDCAAALIDRRQSAGRDEHARRASLDPR